MRARDANLEFNAPAGHARLRQSIFQKAFTGEPVS